MRGFSEIESRGLAGREVGNLIPSCSGLVNDGAAYGLLLGSIFFAAVGFYIGSFLEGGGSNFAGNDITIEPNKGRLAISFAILF